MIVWKDIKGWEGIYQISNTGQVKSLERVFTDSKNRKYILPEKIIQPYIETSGYYRISLKIKNREKKYFLHRLIAEAFIPNPNNLPEIDHIDTNRLNNDISNLRWATRKTNQNNPLTIKHLIDNNNVPTKKVMCVETGKIYESAALAAKEFNLNRCCISNAANPNSKKVPTAAGYHWRYL